MTAIPTGTEIDRSRTVTHASGITQVFRTAFAARTGEGTPIGAYRWLAEHGAYATYHPAGSSLGSYPTEELAYDAVVRAEAVRGRIARLAAAGLRISHAARSDAEDGSLRPYSHYRQDRPEPGTEPFVDLGDIASGEDAYGQVSTRRRSNFRRLQEDYPEIWTLITYTNTDALAAFVADLTDDVTEILAGLASEYAVYDEDDMSALENEEISEQWDDYGADDFRYELPEDVRDAWDDLGRDGQRELFWSACEAAEDYPEHNGVEVLWSGVFETVAPIVAAKLS